MPRRSNLPWILLLLLAACVSPRERGKSLARVAKDWCLTIRASQVIPTYPLTEDLLPGDVFLTTTPVGEEVRQFEEQGFLPLDNLLVRLTAADVFKELEAFYASRFDVLEKVFPKEIDWDHVPDAKFPTYSVEISRSGGLNLAVPVQAVPVGFNYLGAEKATATVTIAEASTLGLDIDRLDGLLEKWIALEGKAVRLRPYGSLPGDPEAQPVFLRVVTRVYYTGKLNVALTDAASGGADVKAGIELPLSLPSGDPSAKTVAERQQDVVKALNASLKDQFGGRVQIASATSRSVTLNEDFERPVAIGYLAFDRRILPDGTLGPAVSTLVKVQGQAAIAPRVEEFDTSNFITAWYTKDEAARRPEIEAWVERNHPGVDVVTVIVQPQYEGSRLRMIRELAIR